MTNSTKNPQVAEDFYSDLQKAVDSVPNRHFLFIGADTNAQIGSGYKLYARSVGKFGKGHLNENGERLGEFLTKNKLIATNTFFDHKLKHRVTWNHPNKNPNYIDKKSGQKRRNPIRNQIDFILTNEILKSEISDSRSYHGTKLESDHNIVICKSKFVIHRIFKKKTPPIVKFNTNKLQKEQGKAKYQHKVVENLIDKESVDWNTIVKAVTSSAEKVLGKAEKPKENFTSDRITSLSEKQLKLRKQIENSQSPSLRQKLQIERNQIKKKLKKELKEEKEKDQLRKIEEVENCKNDSRRMFTAVRELNKKEDKTIIVQDSEGNVLNSTEQKVEIITQYFEDIFSQETTHPLPEIKPQKLRIPITESEVKSAKKILKTIKVLDVTM